MPSCSRSLKTTSCASLGHGHSHTVEVLEAGWVEAFNFLACSPYVPAALKPYVEQARAVILGDPPTASPPVPTSPSPSASFSTPLSRFNPPVASTERSAPAQRGLLRIGPAVTTGDPHFSPSSESTSRLHVDFYAPFLRLRESLRRHLESSRLKIRRSNVLLLAT